MGNGQGVGPGLALDEGARCAALAFNFRRDFGSRSSVVGEGSFCCFEAVLLLVELDERVTVWAMARTGWSCVGSESSCAR